MKIGLVYPYKKTNIAGCNPPISILYLASALKNAGNDVLVIDRDEDNQSIDEIIRKLDSFSPGLVGIPLFSNTLAEAYYFMSALTGKSPGIHIVLGGPHATARPGEILDTFTRCNFLLRGESEQGIVELADAVEKRGGFEAIQGLSYRENNRVIHNPDRLPENNLDTIAFPARELLASAYKKNTYFRLGHRGITDILITSRGCPYNCHFCFKLSRKVRYRSPENILAELIELKSMGINNVHMMDDLFVSPKSRCIKILDLIIENKLNMAFKVRSRVDLISEELLHKMKQAGVKAVVYGFESGSQTMLDTMNKGTTVEKNRRAVIMTKKAGLQCYADVFIGYPGETPETIRETESFIMKTKPTGLNIAVMYPLPETVVYNRARDEHILMDDWNISGSQAWIKLPWINHVSDLTVYRDRILKRYLFHPAVVWNAVRHTLFSLDLRQLGMIIRYYLK